MSDVTPRAILGDPVTGKGGDSLQSLGAKFNNHKHGFVSSSFFQWGIRPNLAVGQHPDTGAELFKPNALVKVVRATELELSSTALQTCEDITLTFGLITVPDCSLEVDSPIVRLNPQSGVVLPETLNSLLVTTISGVIVNPMPGITYPILMRPGYAGVIHTLAAKTSKGDCEVSVKVEPAPGTGAVRTLKPFSIPIVPSAPSNSGFILDVQNNCTFKAEDTLSLYTFNISSSLDLFYTVILTKALI
jgi:hypothetical protein